MPLIWLSTQIRVLYWIWDLYQILIVSNLILSQIRVLYWILDLYQILIVSNSILSQIRLWSQMRVLSQIRVLYQIRVLFKFKSCVELEFSPFILNEDAITKKCAFKDDRRKKNYFSACFESTFEASCLEILM